MDWSLIPLEWQGSHVVHAVRSGVVFKNSPYTRADLLQQGKTSNPSQSLIKLPTNHIPDVSDSL